MTVVINRNTLRYTLQNETNVVLQDKLVGYTGKFQNVEITINSGTTIGAINNAFALRTGDLSVFSGTVTINNYGDIQGIGGTGGDGNGEDGGDAVWLDHPIIFNNYGTVSGGGGAGGRGGRGASGDNVGNWSQEIWEGGEYLWYSGNTDSQWDNVDLGEAGTYAYLKNGSYMYTYGRCNDSGHSCAWKFIKRALVYTGTRGYGSWGGSGQGYNHLDKGGVSAPTSGSYAAGWGGYGGLGGDWGQNGSNGNKGYNGTIFGNPSATTHGGVRYQRITTTDGYGGYTAGDAGNAVVEQAGVTGSTFINLENGVSHGSVIIN